MTIAHLHLLDTESGVWAPATTSGVVGGGGGAGAASTGSATGLDWSYAAGSGGISDTSDVTLAAAPGNGNANYLTSLQIHNTDASVSTEVVIKDGSTVLLRIPVQTGMLAPVQLTFPQPLRTSENTALTAACITNSSQTYINAQGYTARAIGEVVAEYGTDAIELYTSDNDRVMAADGTTFINVSS